MQCEAVREWVADVWDAVKFEAWWQWSRFRSWWVYGAPEPVDATWQTFKIDAEGEGDPDGERCDFIDFVESLNLYFNGAVGSYGSGCDGWVEGPPERMREARRKLVGWFIARNASHVYVSSLLLRDAPYPHPALRV